MRFHNRKEAGKLLADALIKYRGEEVIVYALPRGGVVLGYEVANALNAPLDLLIARKIAHPASPEYAIAAVTESGEMSVSEPELALLDKKWFREAAEKQREEAKRRRVKYLGDRSSAETAGKTAIIVDDGLATGLTMEAGIKELKKLHPKKIVVAVPVAPADTKIKISKMVDEIIVLCTPEIFLGAVGNYYTEFPQVEDEEVIRLMKLIPPHS